MGMGSYAAVVNAMGTTQTFLSGKSLLTRENQPGRWRVAR